MVRKFLYLMAALTTLVIAGAIALAVWWDELSEYVMVPDGEYEEIAPLAEGAYADEAMWFARPGMSDENPARWQPEFAEGHEPDAPLADPPRYALFFIHPTSYIPIRFLDDMHWNGPIGDEDANEQALLFIKGMASPFNRAVEIWIPRYRQAVFGAFLTRNDPRADAALDAAHRDVVQAFDHFLANVDPELPIVIAGHSQGGLHLQRLLAERISGTEVQDRIAMAYSIGWPISIEHDLPALGLPACEVAQDSACVMSWLSFAEPADSGQMLRRFSTSPGFDSESRAGSPVLCTNPVSGTRDGNSVAADNLGTLVPDLDLDSGELEQGRIGSRCGEDGLLYVGAPLDLGPYVLPGNNYHVYDVPMFWRNLQVDVERRVAAWQLAR